MDWKQLLKIRQAKILGLDIGSSSVRIVQLRRDNGSYSVTAAGKVDIKNSTETEDDNYHRDINTVRAICECYNSVGIETSLAVCGVSGPEVAVRHFKFPALLAEEVPGAVLLEAEQICPFNVNEGTVDYQIIPNGDSNISGILVAATNKVIKRKERLAKEASLNTALMDVDGLALLNCLSEYDKAGESKATAVLNVDSSCTNLVVMGDDSFPFIRDTAYAGNNIMEQIAECNSMSIEKVREFILGEGNPGPESIELEPSLAVACQQLISDVNETLRYYAAQEKSGFIERLLVCGGFANVRGFVELLDSQLPVKVVLWNPFEKLRCDAGSQTEKFLHKHGSAMAVAAGLAMRSI